jgi:hypothetical protein
MFNERNCTMKKTILTLLFSALISGGAAYAETGTQGSTTGPTNIGSAGPMAPKAATGTTGTNGDHDGLGRFGLR